MVFNSISPTLLLGEWIIEAIGRSSALLRTLLIGQMN
jgi:hypothetical protein